MPNEDFVLTNFYNPHINGGGSRFADNPVANGLQATRQMYANYLTELCMNRFEWKGLPDSVDPRYLELTLYWRALSVFFKDEGPKSKGYTNTGEFFALPGAGGGMPNVQDVPTHFQVVAPNVNLNIQQLIPGKNCVPIFANYLRIPEIDRVYLFSEKLAQLDRTIEINSMNMRHTKIAVIPENKRNSYTNLQRQHVEGMPMIMLHNKTMNVDEEFSTLDLETSPDSVSKLWDAKHQLWNECYTMLGINNSNQDKRERLVASEVSANDEQVEATRFIALNSRQYAAEQINKLYGLNVSVDFRKPPESAVTEDEESGDNDGEDKE